MKFDITITDTAGGKPIVKALSVTVSDFGGNGSIRDSSTSRREPRVTRASSCATHSGAIAALAKGPSTATGGNPGSTMNWASVGLHRR